MGRPATPELSTSNVNHEGSSDWWEEDNPLVQLAHKRTLILTGDLTESSISVTIAHILNLATDDSNKPIKLIINTEGGYVDEMLALYDIMQYVPCPIHTIGIGKIMSCGLFILSAGEKGHRKIGKNARCMFHLIHGSLDGNILDYDNEVTETKRMQQQVNSILRRHSKLRVQDLEEMCNKKHDVYLTPEQIIKMGIADGLLGE